MVQRFDVGRLDRAQRTGADGARVPAAIARSGVQVYTDAAGNTVREYRPADEVFSAASLATLGSIPVTIGHPGRVDAKNWRQHAVGHVTDAPPARRDDGPNAWLDTTVHVNDARALERVNAGELVEVSMGYTADVVPEKGVAPDGQHYDAVQRNIRFNHLALLEDGRARAGRGARLRLDAAGNVVVEATATDGPSVSVNASVGDDGRPHYSIYAQGLSPEQVRPFLAQTAQNIRDLAMYNNVALLKEIR